MEPAKPNFYKLVAAGDEKPILLHRSLLGYFRTLQTMIDDLDASDETQPIPLNELVSGPIMQWAIDVATISKAKEKQPESLSSIFENVKEYNALLAIENPDRPPLLTLKGSSGLDAWNDYALLVDIILALNWLNAVILRNVVNNLYAILRGLATVDLQSLVISSRKRKKTKEISESGLSFAPLYRREQLIKDYLSQSLPPELVRAKAAVRKYINPIACGRSHQLFIKSNGLYGTGDNRFGQLGLEDGKWSRDFSDNTLKITSVPGIPLMIACKYNTSLCLTTEGLYGCGVNDDGQLGLGSGTPNLNIVVRWTKIPITVEVLDMAIGRTHILLYTLDGLYAAGNNQFGQLGIGTTVSQSTFVRLNFRHFFTSIECGDDFTLLLTPNYLAVCGSNSAGQLGGGGLPLITVAPRVIRKRNAMDTSPWIKSISAGTAHTMYIENETVRVAGSNGYGQTGVIPGQEENTTLVGKPLSIHCGPHYTVCETSDGLYATGNNRFYKLANGDNVDRQVFTKMIGLQGLIYSISCGDDQVIVYTSEGVYLSGKDIVSNGKYTWFGRLKIDMGYRRTIVIVDDEEPGTKKIKLGCEHCGGKARFISCIHQLPFCSKLCLYDRDNPQ